MRIYLASASPRRAELLRQVGIPFTVLEPEVSETVAGTENPAAVVVELAQKKALDVSRRLESGVVIAADTVVVYRGRILGKPGDRDEARQMLRILSGNEHLVYSGLALHDAGSGRIETGLSKTRVWMRPLAGEAIERYVAGGEPLDKAGSYGIQGRGALFIEKIEGCYFNVVGLPLSLLYELLLRMQVPIWLNRKEAGNGE